MKYRLTVMTEIEEYRFNHKIEVYIVTVGHHANDRNEMVQCDVQLLGYIYQQPCRANS